MPLRIRSGKWEWRFQYCGKRYEKVTDWEATEKNKILAEVEETSAKVALIEGRTPVRRLRPRLFGDAVKEFLASARVSYAGRESTYDRIATSCTSLHEKFGSLLVSAIDEDEIENYKVWRLTEHHVQQVTLRHDLHNLSLFFQFAMAKHYCNNNPVRNVAMPSDRDAERMYILSLDEERRYLRHALGDIRDLALLILNQGCRPEELLATAKHQIDAKTNWVDINNRRLYILRGKTRAARRCLSLTDESCAIVARRINDRSVWLFPTPVSRKGKLQKGHDTHEVRLNNAHDGTLKRMHDETCDCNGTRGIRDKKERKAKAQLWRSCPHAPSFVIYDFRHTFATRMAESGCDLPSLAALLGHSSLRMVMKYVHPTEQHKTEAMARYEASRRALEKSGSDHHPPNLPSRNVM